MVSTAYLLPLYIFIVCMSYRDLNITYPRNSSVYPLGVKTVINAEMTRNGSTYIHRVGRTARAGK